MLLRMLTRLTCGMLSHDSSQVLTAVFCTKNYCLNILEEETGLKLIYTKPKEPSAEGKTLHSGEVNSDGLGSLSSIFQTAMVWLGWGHFKIQSFLDWDVARW